MRNMSDDDDDAIEKISRAVNNKQTKKTIIPVRSYRETARKTARASAAVWSTFARFH
jgi:hypothetical protein